MVQCSYFGRFGEINKNWRQRFFRPAAASLLAVHLVPGPKVGTRGMKGGSLLWVACGGAGWHWVARVVPVLLFVFFCSCSRADADFFFFLPLSCDLDDVY